jgi:uncharacterized protein (TIGR04255 family)
MSAVNALPQFRKPPVTEVVQGIQFLPVALTPVHQGLFYQSVREQFPKLNVVPALLPVVERFDLDGSGASPPPPEFIIGAPQLAHRMWFVSADELNLIQVQNDRLLFNWRHQPHTPDYPHYQHVRYGFEEAFVKFQKLVSDEKLGEFTVTMAELSYFNQIVPPSDVGLDRPDRIFAWWPDTSASAMGRQEIISFSMQRRLTAEDGSPIGRLYANVSPAPVPDRPPFYALELTVRGYPVGPGLEGALVLHDLAHEAIVTTFAAMTTSEMHDLWERIP